MLSLLKTFGLSLQARTFMGHKAKVLSALTLLSILPRTFALAATFAATWPAVTFADVLPSADFGGRFVVAADVYAPDTSVTGTGTISQSKTGSFGGTASATLFISTAPLPTVSLQSAVGGPEVNGVIGSTVVQGGLSGLQGYVSPVLTYNVEFLGPEGAVPIQVNATLYAAMTATAPGGYGDELVAAGMTVFSQSGEEFQDIVNIQNGTGFTVNYAGQSAALSYSDATGIAGSLTDSHVWIAQTNVVYTVGLGVLEELSVSGAFGGGPMSDSAMVDPTFQISSQAIDPSLYSVLVSPGVGNEVTSPVPEPASGLVLMLGMAFIGVVGMKADRSRRPSDVNWPHPG